MNLVAVWSVITMLQDASILIDLTKKQTETKRIAKFLMKQLPITENCAQASAEKAFDSMVLATKEGGK